MRTLTIRCPLLVIPLAATSLVLTACGISPRPEGEADPGGRRMTILTPVLSVVPADAQQVRRASVKATWDSCDGVRSTYGWNPVTVTADFTAPGTTATEVSVAAAMRTLGWTPDATSGGGQWTWHRVVNAKTEASAQLLGDAGSTTAQDWSLQASIPAATHPVKGC